MTTEAKAKAYDEAMNRIKPLYEQAKKDGNPIWSTYEYIFSELDENDDERIRKEIIEFIDWAESRGSVRNDWHQKKRPAEWIAYLEKQKDASKAIEAVDRIDKYIDWHVANAHDMKDSDPEKKYYRGWDDALGKMAGILQDVYSNEKQKEQDPIKVEVYEVGKGTAICGQDYKCKKDYRSGVCWYIKDVIYHCCRDGYLTDQNGVSWSCTPEWFNEYIYTNSEWADKEKNDFVSGQFLRCKLSFDEFKEGEHYWFEYIGNDTYVGRSDNVLNQKFHITPRQLYTLFSQQLDEVQGPPEEEKQVSLNYEPPFDENPSDKEIVEALIKHLKEQDGFLTAINCVSTKAILSWLEKQEEQKHYWKPTETDAALFNKAVTTNNTLTPAERAQLDIIRSKFGCCRAVNCSGIVQKEQKDFNKLYEDIAKSEWFQKSYNGKSLGCDDVQEPVTEVFGFKVGDKVRLKDGDGRTHIIKKKDGDGRTHIIKKFEKIEGVHGPDFYHVEFEDNSARDGIYPGEEYPNGYYTQMEKLEKEQKSEQYSPLCNTIKDKIREYVVNHFVTDTVVKTDVKSIVKAMEEGVRLGKEKQKPWEWGEEEAKVLGSIIDDYEKASKSFCGYDGKIGFLKAIRDGEYNLPKPTECKATINGEPIPNENQSVDIPLAEWSEEDEKELDCIINILDRLGYEEFCKSSRDQDIEEERFYYKEIQFLKRLKSLHPQKKLI